MEPVPSNTAAGGAMSPAHAALWQRIRMHPFECANDGVDFLTKLIREQGWTRDYARAAIDEYRRYCFLAATAGREMVPSDAVDQVWHLHLTYTRDYWTVFCPTVLGCDLHHEPSRARDGDAQRFADSYADTLATYAGAFGPPPEEFWPGTRERFRHPARFRRIDSDRYFILPRPRVPSLRTIGAMLVALVLAVAARSVFASGANPLDWNGEEFLVLYIVLIITCAIATFFWRRHLRDNGATGNDIALDTWDVAYLAGGSERVMDCAVARLMRDKLVVWDADAKRLKMDAKITIDDPLLDRIARHLMIEGSPRKLARRLEPEFSRIRDKLASRGLLLDADAKSRASWLPTLLPAALLAFGMAKVMIGLSREKPVAFLVVLMIIIAIAALVSAFATSSRALAGDRALASLKQRHAHTARAPRPDDLPLAVALAGTAVLATTPYSAYHQFRQPSSGSDGGSSSGSSCSGGGGGSCGGCGGGD